MVKDFFRDTSIRYLGYANEIGEALRPVIDKKYVRYSYGVAFGYICADTIDKSVGKLVSDGRPHKALWAAGDAILWQGLASIVFPGLAINRIVKRANVVLPQRFPKVKSLPPHQRMYLTMAIALASMPIIVRPIDFGTDVLMSMTYRLFFS